MTKNTNIVHFDQKSVKKNVLKMHHKSIKQNPTMLATNAVEQFKTFVFKTAPEQLFRLNKQLETMFNKNSMQCHLSSVHMLDKAIANFENTEDMINYRRLYQRRFRPFVAMEDTLLLPNGYQSTNDRFYNVFDQIINDTNDILWSLNECSGTLNLLKPPLGNEKSYDIKVFASLLELIGDLINLVNVFKSKILISSIDKRSNYTTLVFLTPQLEDSRQYARETESKHFFVYQQLVVTFRNCYCILNHFVITNWKKIEDILKRDKIIYK